MPSGIMDSPALAMISLREMELSVGQATVEALDGATLTFTFASQPGQVVVPCVHGPILKNFDLGNGKSALTMISFCDFRACFFEGIADDSVIVKGLQCTLLSTPGADPLYLQLWTGGLLPGGAVYKFVLVDANYKG